VALAGGEPGRQGLRDERDRGDRLTGGRDRGRSGRGDRQARILRAGVRGDAVSWRRLGCLLKRFAEVLTFCESRIRLSAVSYQPFVLADGRKPTADGLRRGSTPSQTAL
jgi:hypothetical protein